MHGNISNHYPKRYGIYKDRVQDTSINIYISCVTISSSLTLYLSIDNNGDNIHEDSKNPTAVATTYIIILQSVQLCRLI